MALSRGLRDLLMRVERGNGSLQMLQVTASGGRASAQINELLRLGYIVKTDHPSVVDRRTDWPAEALAITAAGKSVLAGETP